MFVFLLKSHGKKKKNGFTGYSGDAAQEELQKIMDYKELMFFFIILFLLLLQYVLCPFYMYHVWFFLEIESGDFC